jgi:hypothetical protein
VQAVSDDGRYVALGHMNSDPSHVNEAHFVLDMHTGTLVNLPPTAQNGAVNKVYFRPDGVMIATFPDTQEQYPDGRHLVACHPWSPPTTP